MTATDEAGTLGEFATRLGVIEAHEAERSCDLLAQALVDCEAEPEEPCSRLDPPSLGLAARVRGVAFDRLSEPELFLGGFDGSAEMSSRATPPLRA